MVFITWNVWALFLFTFNLGSVVHGWCGKFANPPKRLTVFRREAIFCLLKKTKFSKHSYSFNFHEYSTYGDNMSVCWQFRSEHNVTEWKKNALWLTTLKWIAQCTPSREAKWKVGLLSLKIIIGVFVPLVYGVECSVQGESRALRQQTGKDHTTLVNLSVGSVQLLHF